MPRHLRHLEESWRPIPLRRAGLAARAQRWRRVEASRPTLLASRFTIREALSSASGWSDTFPPSATAREHAPGAISAAANRAVLDRAQLVASIAAADVGCCRRSPFAWDPASGAMRAAPHPVRRPGPAAPFAAEDPHHRRDVLDPQLPSAAAHRRSRTAAAPDCAGRMVPSQVVERRRCMRQPIGQPEVAVAALLFAKALVRPPRAGWAVSQGLAQLCASIDSRPWRASQSRGGGGHNRPCLSAPDENAAHARMHVLAEVLDPPSRRWPQSRKPERVTPIA